MSKTIHLSEEAYEHLAVHRRDDETFSEAVLRLASERSLVDLAGAVSEAEGTTLGGPADRRPGRHSADRPAGDD